MKSRHVVGRSKTTVEKIRFSGEGGFHGVGTRVTFADGWTMTFMGPVSKTEAIKQAAWHRSRGMSSEGGREKLRVQTEDDPRYEAVDAPAQEPPRFPVVPRRQQLRVQKEES